MNQLVQREQIMAVCVCVLQNGLCAANNVMGCNTYR